MLVFNIGLESKDGCLPICVVCVGVFSFFFFNITVLLQLLRLAKRGNKRSANPEETHLQGFIIREIETVI